jgi:hypothetical protein
MAVLLAFIVLTPEYSQVFVCLNARIEPVRRAAPGLHQICDSNAYDVVRIQKVAGFSEKHVKLMSEIDHQGAIFASTPHTSTL